MRAMGSTEAADGGRRWPASLVVSGVLALVVAVVGWIGVAAWLSSAAHPRSGEWRTEQFRDITFRVPVEWGYAAEPGPDWCGYDGFRNPRLRPDQQRPYVSLGAGNISFGCSWPQPDALISEHVAAQSTAAVRDTFEQLYGIEQPTDGQYRLARGYSEIIRTVGTVRLRVVSRNLDLARQIADSAAPTGADEACRPTVDRQPDRAPRPDPSFDVGELDSVRSITLCQYDGFELQARTDLGEAEAGRLIKTIAASPVERGADCRPEPSPIWWELVVLIHLRTADGDKLINVYVHSCGAHHKQIRGGFDDGTAVRVLTRENCRAVLPQPLGFISGYLPVHDLCAA
jgi:hypothetical protein